MAAKKKKEAKKQMTSTEMAIHMLSKANNNGITAVDLNKAFGRKTMVGIGPMKTVLNRLARRKVIKNNGTFRDGDFPVYEFAANVTKDNAMSLFVKGKKAEAAGKKAAKTKAAKKNGAPKPTTNGTSAHVDEVEESVNGLVGVSAALVAGGTVQHDFCKALSQTFHGLGNLFDNAARMAGSAS